MTDLIERLELAECCDKDSTLIREVIDALKLLEAPLPEDVEQKTIWLRQEAIRICDISPNINSPNETQEWELADMLERLARELECCKRSNAAMLEMTDADHAQIEAQQQRIEELEAEKFQLDHEAEKWASRYDKATLSIKRLAAALAKAAIKLRSEGF